MIPGDLLSAFPHRQFHTLPGHLESWAALPNPFPNALRAMQGGSLYHFYDGLWYDPAERRTRYRLSQPDTVICLYSKAIRCNQVIETYTLIIVIGESYTFINTYNLNVYHLFLHLVHTH